MTNTHISRRTIVRGTTWAAPAVLATSAIPAYAASGCLDSYAVLTPGITTWTVPAGVTRLCSVEIMGGAGGSTTTTLGGSGSLVTADSIPVTAGQTITLYVGDGGTTQATPFNGTGTAFGGKGFGKGGDSISPAGYVGTAGGSGGGGTAIVIGSTPVLVAGGGGGAANMTIALPAKGYAPKDSKSKLPVYEGVEVNVDLKSPGFNPFVAHPGAPRLAGGVGGAGNQPGLDGQSSQITYRHAPNASYASAGGGHGSVAGVGGNGGSSSVTFNGAFPSNFTVGERPSVEGFKGEDNFGSKGTGAAGANGQGIHLHASPDAPGSTVAGGAGGGGYGGGGSGSAYGVQLMAYDFSDPSYTFYSSAAVGNAGGGGGSYAAPLVVGPKITIGNNAKKGYQLRFPGYIKFSYGK